MTRETILDPARRAPKRLVALIPWLFITAGVGMILVAADLIPTDPRKFEAPRWVVGAAGLVFAMAGIAMATARPEHSAPGARATLRTFLPVLGIVGGMAAIANWVAFGPGERHFSGGISIPFVSFAFRSSEWTGRAAFGIGAVMLDCIVVILLYTSVRDLFRGRYKAPRGPAPRP